MATATPLEEQISCSVCFEIYREPYILKECLHTFCLQCIEQLVKAGRIECPTCREYTHRANVRKDFSMQGFVDLHYSELESKEKPPTIGTCGLCFISERPIKALCESCEHYMCSGCEVIHSRMKFEKKHNVKSMKQVIQECNSQFAGTLDELSKQKRSIVENITNIDKSIKDVEVAKHKQLSDVQKITEDSIRELKENKKKVENMINQANTDFLAQLSELKTTFIRSQEEVQQHMKSITDFITTGDVTFLKEKVHKINQTTQDSLKETISKLPKIQNVIKSPVTVSKGELVNAKSTIDISISNPKLVVSFHFNYLEILKHSYSFQSKEALKYDPMKICLINGQLWCGSANRAIYIYDKDCRFIRQLCDERYLGNITLCQANNDNIIVACSNGLYQLNSEGKYQMTITEGTFSDVYSFGEALYALDTNQKSISIFHVNGNNWRKNQQFKLDNHKVHDWDRIAVSGNGIYVTSFIKKSLHVYNFQGFLVNHFEPGSLKGPFISGADAQSNVLISDHSSSNLIVCDSKGICQRLNLQREIVGIIHALVDPKENYIWAVSYECMLYKFSKNL